jgi:lipoprotein-anchoring transpeptidase ErfK/SrfK
MRYRSLIIAVAVIGVLLAGAGAVYAYDRGHRDVIADGIKVEGIDIGGLTAAQARARLHADYLPRFRRPVVVQFHGHSFKLSPTAARVRVDVDAAVDQALQRSREGTIFTRVWRSVTGAQIDANLEPHVAYSRAVVARLVGRVRGTVDRPARDASVSYSAESIATVPSRTGLEVNGAALTRTVGTALERPAARHRITVPVAVVEPKVSTSSLARRYPSFITIDRAAFTLRVYQHLRLARSYPIAVGMQGLQTPAGLYHVQNKVVDPSWNVPNSPWAGSLAGQVIPPGPQDPLKARWMGLWNGAGIHGTDETGSIGHAFSHGCVRMLIPDVIDLYDRVRVGTPVYIGG